MPLNVEMKLEVWDSPNSAGIVIDAVRCCKLALNHGVGGQLDGPSSYLMKSPHNQRPDDEAREATEKFIAKHARQAAAEARRRRRAARSAPRAQVVAAQPSARRAAPARPTHARRGRPSRSPRSRRTLGGRPRGQRATSRGCRDELAAPRAPRR